MIATRKFASAFALACALSVPAHAQSVLRSVADTAPPPVPREMRAVWVATVDNMDWPSRMGLSTAEQQRELIDILDRLVALRMNAVILQVRPAADAFYASKLEPWSEYLTGEMGRAPSPYYDPLAFAVTEAHKRGLELHAWINPYRARYSTKRPASKNHVSRAKPSLVRKYGSYLWMDPGDPAVRALTKNVVLDLVRRYDIDGLHMDDYFYPYKEQRRGRDIPFPDASTYKRYTKGGGKLSRDDWRRQNVNLLVKELYDGIHEVKPSVRFGISPFGIWRPGFPASVRGLDQYSELYADARKWVNEGWLDYVTPQLYWSVDRPQQRYDQLLQWWDQENFKRRHLWPGNYTSKVGFNNSSKFPVSEILEQIRLTRAQPGATGNVHFSMEVFKKDPDGINEALERDSYAVPALIPASTWLPGDKLAAPVMSTRVDNTTGERVLDFRSGTSAAPWLWVVQSRGSSGWATQILPGSYRGIVISGRDGVLPLDVRVRAVDRVGNLGPSGRFTPAP
ncbi:MAG: family 10 glycosylhydrolase [Gemmatimonadaceae bacterium]